jgi:hypothetical protein
MNWLMLSEAEKSINKRIFMLLLFSTFLYLIIAVLYPFFGAGSDSPNEYFFNIPPIKVLGAYGGFIVVSSFIEFSMH